jgi:polar amino acid transport system substrate-binding protein
MTNDATDAVRSELAPTGKLRAAINLGNPILAQKDATTGEVGGVSVDIARELGRRLGVTVDLATYDTAGKAFDAVRTGTVDVAFLAIDPKRAADIDFTAPYVIIEGGYVVPADSPLRAIDDVDRPGIRIAVVNASAYELHLSRTIRHAELVRASTGPESTAMFLRDKLDVLAGVKSPLQKFAKTRTDMRVMDGRFMAIEQAMCVPKGREAGARYLRAMIEELKASGFVASGLERTGQHDARVAPAA